MTAVETAAACAGSVSGLASHFMLDPATYATGAQLGFEGMSFYVAGRAGVLGDVDADVVNASLIFFQPDGIRDGWDSARGVMDRSEAAIAFINCGYTWAESHLPDDLDAARLATLAGLVAAQAPVAGAPLFAGWRAVESPSIDQSAKAAALHEMNLLRELRFAYHALAVIAAGIQPLSALSLRQPYMVGLFGWPEPDPDAASCQEAWDSAEDATDRLFGAALAVLSDAEQAEFVALASQAQEAATAG